MINIRLDEIYDKGTKKEDIALEIKAPIYWWNSFFRELLGKRVIIHDTYDPANSVGTDLCYGDFSTEYLDPVSSTMLVDTIRQINRMRKAADTAIDNGDVNIGGIMNCINQLVPQSLNVTRIMRVNGNALRRLSSMKYCSSYDEWYLFVDWMDKNEIGKYAEVEIHSFYERFGDFT